MSRARALDQFYLSRPVAKECFDTLRAHIRSNDNDFFLEPSAGEGAFFDLMPPDRRIGIDIEPKHAGVQQGDFLHFKLTQAAVRRVVAAGNPPFGKNSGLAVRFFNHAAEFCDVIAFIVPKTFRKDSLVERLHRHFHKERDEELPEKAFVFEGRACAVPCCFQIWVRGEAPRVQLAKPLMHPDFCFTTREVADIAFRRVGRLAGMVLRDFEGYSSLSHYFIKGNIPVELLVNRLRGIDWTSAKTSNAGNPSIGKRELVEAYSTAAAEGHPPEAG